jgi:hypothetical protein
VTVPPSLRSQELDGLWARVRARLEARGTDHRGRLSVSALLSSSAKLALKSLVGRPVCKTVDLAALEAGLARLGLGANL